MDEKEILNELDNAEELQDEYTLVKHYAKHQKTKRKIRKKRKKVSRLRTFAGFVVFVLLIFLAYRFVMLPQWYLPQDTFKKCDTQRIEIINNKLISTPIIIGSLKNVPIPKLPIFLMDVENIKKELYKNPVIKNVYVRRYAFPARIQIIIRERVPIVVMKSNLKSRPFAFFTSDGILVTNRLYMPFAENDSTLRIIMHYQKLGADWNSAKIEYLRKIVKAVEFYSNEKVLYIDMQNPNDVYIKIESTNIRLGALDSTVFERIKRIYTILPQIEDMNNRIKYIDLSWDKVNYLKLKQSK